MNNTVSVLSDQYQATLKRLKKYCKDNTQLYHCILWTYMREADPFNVKLPQQATTQLITLLDKFLENKGY